MDRRRWHQKQTGSEQEKSRDEGVGARGIYLGGGSKLYNTEGKESAKDVVKEEKGGQHEQGDYASSSNLKCFDSCGLRQVKK